jgi:hypothetical protein
MRKGTWFLAGALLVAAAAPAHACNFYFSSTFMKVPAKPSFGVGVNGALGDPSVWGISGDVAMRLGDNAVVQPAIGYCTGGGTSDPYFGAGVAYRLSNNSSMGVNLQSGISYQKFDGGNSMTIPIGAALSFGGSSAMSFFAGGSLWWTSFEVDGAGSSSDTSPVVFGGVNLASGAMAWTVGGQLLMGDDTEFGIVLGANMNQGVNPLRWFQRR